MSGSFFISQQNARLHFSMQVIQVHKILAEFEEGWGEAQASTYSGYGRPRQNFLISSNASDQVNVQDI
jgi:hypothetical protein